MRRALPLMLVLALPGLAAGCAEERTPAPEAGRPGQPFGFQPVRLEDGGVSFGAPRGWNYREPGAPLLATMNTGTAVIAVWRYPRAEPLPDEPPEVEAALANLKAAARAREPGLLILDESIEQLDGQPAVALTLSTTIAGRRRTVVSVHAYAFGAEVIVDAYAGPRDFFRVNAQTFQPLLDSVELTEPKGDGEEAAESPPADSTESPPAATPESAPAATPETPPPAAPESPRPIPTP